MFEHWLVAFTAVCWAFTVWFTSRTVRKQRQERDALQIEAAQLRERLERELARRPRAR